MLHRLLPLLLLTLPAHAVIVRGKVTTALGRALPGSRVQLIQLTGGARSVADAVSGLDGEYEIRTDLAGRFLLLTSSSLIARQAAAEIGDPFYAGRTDLLTIDVFLTPPALTPQLTAQATLLSTPLAELATATTQIAASQLLTHATPLPELRQLPSVVIVESGPTGTPAFLYLRGASPAATKVLIDGASAEDLGGGFNLSTLSASGLSAPLATPAVEVTPVANPLLFLGAEAGLLAFESPRAATLHPNLTYTGDAGNLGALRNEAVATLAHSRFDLLGSFSRFDQSTHISSEHVPFHIATTAANLGYSISANTGFHLTLRNDTAAAGLPNPFSFLPAFAIAPPGKQADQNLYSTFAFDTRTAFNWHNLARVAVVRKRAETLSFFDANTAPSTAVTIAGANGSTATGLASFLNLPAREDRVTNREEYSYETDYPIPHLFTALFTARYQAERAADLLPPLASRLARTHLSFAGGLQGEFYHRLFYTTSGLLDHSPLLGFRGAPRLGLTYVPILPGPRRFRGTSLHATVATSLREPSLAEQIASPAHPITPRSRTFDASVDQSLVGTKLTLRATYFHNQFSHESEPLSLVPFTLSQTLAFRTQGLESTLRYQPFSRLLLHGGYTYLAALVEQSATPPSFNPALPGLPIGALSALPGARPFHRPPHTGFFAAEYTGPALTATLKAAFSSRSDDSTSFYLNPALLLPNRDLSPGYTSLDASLAYAFTRHVTAFTQLTNLTGERHLAPVGYLSTPFLIRTGLRIRIGRE